MKNKPIWMSFIAAMAWAMFFAAAPVKAADDSAMEVGKSVKVNFGSKIKVGNLTLTKGAYRIQHQVDGARHFIHFTEIVGAPYKNPGAARIPGTIRGDRGNVQCKAELLPARISRTAVTTTEENGVRRITRIEIAGENVAHLF